MQTFFDISDIATYVRHHDRVTGIQRATVQIIAEAHRQRPDALWLSYLRPGETTYLCVPASTLIEPLTAFDAAALRQAFGLRRDEALPRAPFLDRYQKKPVKLAYHTWRFKRALAQGNTAFLEKRGVDVAGWQRAQALRSETHALGPQRFETIAKSGDVLCALGAPWGMPALDAAMARAQGQGLRTYVLVHDLIPMKLPELADFTAARAYYDWLAGTPDHCTGYLANSASTARDLQVFLDTLGVDRPVHVTPLAQAQVSDRPLAAPAKPRKTRPPAHAAVLDRSRAVATLDPAVREATLQPFVLCVGTIEPRKNLWRLVQAWDRLRHRTDLELPRLVLAGKRGWLMDGFLDMLHATGGLGGWVTHLDGVSDAALDHLYRHCDFTAMVSLYEGWGLPIGEGLSYGKTGVVSETSSMPEVGGDMVVYCDPHSVTSIAAAVEQLVADPQHKAALEARIAACDLRSWRDVGTDVLAVLEAGSGAH